MKPNFVRQPLLPALGWLLLLVGVALAWGKPVEGSNSAPLGDLLGEFQLAAPIWSKMIAALLLLFSGIRVGRFGVRYNLYPVATSLPIPLYGVVACGILIGQNWLPEFAAAFVLLLSARSFFAGCRNGYAIGLAFRGALFLGLLPLIYAPALPLPLLVLPAALCFRRTLREVLVAVCGALLPLLTLCYLTWAMGGDFLEPLRRAGENMMSDSGFHLLKDTPLTGAILAGIVLVTVFGAIVFSIAHFRRLGRRAKAILVYTILLWATTCVLAFLPSATAGLMALIALPAAILMPQTFIRIPPPVATLLYVLLYGGCIANILLT